MPRRKPPKAGRSSRFEDLVAIMRILLGENGCPWDRKQSHRTLIKYLREESREVERAIKKRDWENLREELGDLLLQIVFHSVLAEKKGRFSWKDVIRGINAKLVRRHPHVFAGDGAKTAGEVLKNWKRIKAEEKKRKRKRKTGRGV